MSLPKNNCRNCGAPHNGCCGYCGTIYYAPVVKPIQHQKKRNEANNKIIYWIIVVVVCIGGLIFIKKLIKAK